MESRSAAKSLFDIPINRGARELAVGFCSRADANGGNGQLVGDFLRQVFGNAFENERRASAVFEFFASASSRVAEEVSFPWVLYPPSWCTDRGQSDMAHHGTPESTMCLIICGRDRVELDFYRLGARTHQPFHAVHGGLRAFSMREKGHVASIRSLSGAPLRTAQI